MRRVLFLAAALLATLVLATPVAAASASSWRATIVGGTLHGGATTLIRSDGTGTINVKVYGVTPGLVPVALVNPALCPVEAQDLFGFGLSAANAAGVSTGRHTLTAAEVKAYNAALSARTKISILVVTRDDKGCGDQAGAPAVGTARIQGSIPSVSAVYDIRYPVIGGIDATVATAVNGVLAADAQATITAFTQDATSAGVPSGGDPPSVANQTFSVSLSQPTLLSLGELYGEYLTGAAHGGADLRTWTFDLTTGHRITLAELFRPGSGYLNVLSTESRTRLRALFHDPSLDDFINPGTTPSVSNFRSWQLTTAGLKITFGEYQVAPYAMGMPSIVIPWTTLRPVLNLRSSAAPILPPGPCLATQLSASMSPWDAGLGSRFDTVALKNTALIPCWLQGTPQAQLVDGTGRVLLDSASAGASGLPHVDPHDPRIVVAAGASARIDVRTTNYCGSPPVAPVRIALRLPSGGGRVIAPPPPGGSATDGVPPCNGPTAPGSISTNGWHHA